MGAGITMTRQHRTGKPLRILHKSLGETPRARGFRWDTEKDLASGYVPSVQIGQGCRVTEFDSSGPVCPLLLQSIKFSPTFRIYNTSLPPIGRPATRSIFQMAYRAVCRKQTKASKVRWPPAPSVIRMGPDDGVPAWWS